MSRTDVLTEKAQELLFNDLLSRAENQQCADCDNKTPTWASIDFGIFICMRCAGVHRQLGPHITRVRSTKLDTWKKENVEILAHVGNKIANDFYEAKMPSGFRKPTSNYTMSQVAKFVDEKYIKKLFAPNHSQTPVKEFVSNRENGIIKPPTLTKEKSEPSSHHREKLERKRSLSLEQKKEQAPVKQNQDIDLLSAADDLLTSQSDANLFEEFQNAEPQPKETKKVSFEGFKKQGSQQQQGGDLLQANLQTTTNPVFQFNFNPNQNSQQTQQTTQQQTQQQQNNFQQQFFQQNSQQQTQQQQTQQQQTTNKQPDLMSLYSQSSTTTSNNTKGYGSNNHNWNELNFLGNNTQQTQQLGGMNNFGYSNYNQQSNFGYQNNQNGFNNNYGGYNNGTSNGYNGYGNSNGYNNGGYNNGYNNGGFNNNVNNGGFNNGGYSNQGNFNNGFGNNNFGTQNMYSNNNFMKLN